MTYDPRLLTIEEIFHAALDCKPDEVGTFLDERCASDEVLRGKVEELVAAHRQAGSFIETAVATVAASIVENGQTDLVIGQSIGHYKILERIGSGGMGEVYLAFDAHAGRKAALKLLPKQFTGDAERLKRFQQEARAVAGLNHPNILTVYEVGADDSVQYIASELIEGETLRQRLARGSMQLSEAIEIAIQATSALAAAHQTGIVHRDVKPENIMLRPDSYVKVLDFGIAKLAEQEVPPTMPQEDAVKLVETNLGSVLGTVRYMSPEQVCGAPVDKRTDIWSLGAVLYEMAAGHAPFTGNTPGDVMSAILEKEPPPLNVQQISGELEQIVSTALRKDPEQRYQNANEMLEALKGLRHKLEFAAELERYATPRFWVRWIRSPTAVVLTLLAVALALTFPLHWLRKPTSTPTQENSIAVLPFENLSAEKENAYFADGVQDEILTDLAKIAELKVISRASVMHYKSGARRNLRQIARELGVAHVVEGSVQRVGNRVRVSAQLIDARTGRHLWAETYDRDVADVFAIQSEIAKTIAEQLQAKLSPQEKAAIEKRPPTDIEAYEAYLRGCRYFDELEFDKSIDYLSQAIKLAPGYGAPYAKLAVVYSELAFFNMLPPNVAFERMRHAALNALEKDNTLSQAHGALALVKLHYDLDFTGAENEFKRALELNPNDAAVRHDYSHYLMAVGRTADSAAETAKALALDPVSMDLISCLCWHRYAARQYDESIAQAQKAIQLEPDLDWTHVILGWDYEQKGKFQDAINEFQKAVKLSKDSEFAIAALGHAYAIAGKKEELREILEKLRGISAQGYVSAFDMAVIYTGLGDKEEALQWLRKAYEERSSFLVYSRWEPRLDPLRSDPRFQELLHRIGLPP